MESLVSYKLISASLIYSFMGIGILVFSFWLIEMITPENIWKEILEKQNMALALIFAAFIIAIAIIVGASIHG
jgi:putative membrane protein